MPPGSTATPEVKPVRQAVQIAAAGMTGALIGGAAGAAVASGVNQTWWLGAAIGVLMLGGLSAWADARRVPGRPQPLLVRIVASSSLAAIVGWLLETALPSWGPLVPSVAVGSVAGAIGFRPGKVLLGGVVGLVTGLIFTTAWAEAGWAVPVAATVLVYRTLAAWLWLGRDQIQIMGERMAQDRARYVVPFAEATRHVGVDYLERHALSIGAAFSRGSTDVGIIDSLDTLRGPGFDPALVHPMVREFYEHTGRFTLSIVPEWRWWMRLPYRIYRESVAKPLGQANAPFEIEEVQRGVVSWIDTIDVDLDGTADFRAWIRAYQDGEPIYIGIYTVQEIDGVSYVAVGFPLPAANFTATLAPSNHLGDGLLLSSSGDDVHAGHYLSVIEETGELTTLRLRAFGETIEVFPDGDKLKTEHRFTLGGLVFLTLHYQIRPRAD